jgi:hypothetical protein
MFLHCPLLSFDANFELFTHLLEVLCKVFLLLQGQGSYFLLLRIQPPARLSFLRLHGIFCTHLTVVNIFLALAEFLQHDESLLLDLSLDFFAFRLHYCLWNSAH